MMSVVPTKPPYFLPAKFDGAAISPTELNPLPPPTLPSSSFEIKNPTLDQTKQLHAHFLRAGFRHCFLPHFYPPSAHLNPLISSYTQNNRPLTAFNLYVHSRKILPAAVDSFTVPTVLKACSLFISLQCGAELHGFSIKVGLDRDSFIPNSLIRMYSDCADLISASKVFDEMTNRDVVSWSTMIQSYGKCGLFHKAMVLMAEMLSTGVILSEITMINAINVLADVAVLGTGKQLHALIMKSGQFSRMDVNISASLIDMYSKCGCRDMARSVFDRANDRNTASWTAMINCYAQSRDFLTAVELFAKMIDDNVMPSEITIRSLASNFGIYEEILLGKWLHAYMLRHRLEMEVTLATALLDLYCKCGYNKCARALFDSMAKKEDMAWSVMILGYSQANCFDDAFELFSQMKELGAKANEFTMVKLLSLCAEAGALDRGKSVHAFITQQRIEIGVVLATALVDMYAKCGEMEEAWMVFCGFDGRDVCMWNAMLNGLAMNGHGSDAIRLFSQMIEAGIRPNGVSFVGILKACSHNGLVLEGKRFFHRMMDEFGLVPSVEHYGCMVDLLGRAGFLDEAHGIVRSMPVAPNVVVWGALLGACKVHRNLWLGELAASEILKLENQNVGCNILLSNIYAVHGRWNDVANVRRTVKEGGLKKAPAVSSIELNGSIHAFVSGDVSHLQTGEVHEMVMKMMMELKRAGHVTNTSAVLLNIDEEEKESTLCFHSEKLAIAFGLINTEPHTRLRIVKNLRVCDDCHAATKLLSKIYGRIITVRDRNRYHHFAEGYCSCGDYW